MLKGNCIPFSRVPGKIRGRQNQVPSKIRELGAEEFVIGTVRHGYRLVFEADPPSASFTSNNRFELFGRWGWVFKPAHRSREPAQVCRYLGLDFKEGSSRSSGGIGSGSLCLKGGCWGCC